MIINVVEGVCDEVASEDGGRAFIATVYDEATAGDRDGLFVRVQSWSAADPPQHPVADLITGKRIRVTIEVLD